MRTLAAAAAVALGAAFVSVGVAAPAHATGVPTNSAVTTRSSRCASPAGWERRAVKEAPLAIRPKDFCDRSATQIAQHRPKRTSSSGRLSANGTTDERGRC